MKKLFVILGNTTFEGKLVAELSSRYQHVGSSNKINQSVLQEVMDKETDVIIVRESLAENQQAFSDFIDKLCQTPHKVKIVAITQNHPVGDPVIRHLVSCGVHDIINNGTRLTDLIEYSIRESSMKDVVHLLSEDQAIELVEPKENEPSSNRADVIDEEIVIDIDGELSIENRRFVTGFKERYIHSVAQAYSPLTCHEANEIQQAHFVNETPEGQIKSIDDDYESRLPGYIEKGADEGSLGNSMSTLDEQSAFKEETLSVLGDIKAATVVQHEAPAKIVLHYVVHCLASSIAMQRALDLSHSKRVVYIETQYRNTALLPVLERAGIETHFANKSSEVTGVINEYLYRSDFVIVNIYGVYLPLDLSVDAVSIEILQDKDMVTECHGLLDKYATAKVVVAYFEHNLTSIKSLNKGLGRAMVRWDNSRLEEHNSRLNACVLSNAAVKEVNKGVL